MLFPLQKDGHLRQLAWLKFASLSEPVAANIHYKVNGVAQLDVSCQILPGGSRVELLIPDLSEEGEVEVVVEVADGAVLHWRGPWKPSRKWKVYSVKSSHYDLGYDGRIDGMQLEAANYLDIAARLCTDHDQLHDWHYHIEHLRFLRAYGRERGAVALAAFVRDYIKSGVMTLSGNSSGPHFHWMDYEQLARFSYPARREMADRHGLDLRGIAVVDNPSVSWAAYQALAQAGFRYLLRFGQSFRSSGDSFANGLPAVAWMTGPDGKSRILTDFHDTYGEPLFLGNAGSYGAPEIAIASEQLSERLQKVERGEVRGPYPYDALIIPNYVDWEVPHEEERVLAQWRRSFVFPEIHFDNAFKGLEYIEKNFAADIPVLNGDTNNNSGDYTSIAPDSQGIKRRLTRLLPFSEALHAVAAPLAPDSLIPATARFVENYLDLVEFDEHCWPTMLSVSEQNIFNTVVTKVHALDRVFREVERSLATTSRLLLGETSSTTGRFAVFNSLAHARSGIAELHLPEGSSESEWHVLEESTGCHLPGQVDFSSGRLRFVATVPAFGYACYQLVPGGMESDADEMEVFTDGDTLIIANRWQELRVSASNGKVVGWRSRQLDRELLDPGSSWAMNDFIRCHAPEFSYTSVSADLSLSRIGESTASHGVNGPLSAEIEIVTTDDALDVHIVTRLRLYAAFDQMDILNDVKRMGFLHTAREDRYRENVFVAFPVLVPNASFRAEYGPGTFDPATDFIPSSNTDFITLNRWIEVSNDDFGVTFAPHEAATVHCGRIKYNSFAPSFEAPTSHLFSYAWSNRMAGLTKLSAPEYQSSLSYSLRPHSGGWRGQATKFGWETAEPLRVFPAGVHSAQQSSFLEVAAPNVQVTVLKRASLPGGGYIVRLVETEGLHETGTQLVCHFAHPTRAVKCDLVENDLEELAFDGSTLSVRLGSYEMLTIRLQVASESLPEVIGLGASRVSDSSLVLGWSVSGESEAPGFHIFRSEVAEEYPNLETLVGYSVENNFTDVGLKPGTDYYYHVAAATPQNSQGKVSDCVMVRTSLENQSPPSRIDDVNVIPIESDRLWLYWRRSEEPDTAIYRVYHSTEPDFDPSPQTLAAEIKPDKFHYQIYPQGGIQRGETWYYRVRPVDYAGNEQNDSLCVSGTTPRDTQLFDSTQSPVKL